MMFSFIILFFCLKEKHILREENWSPDKDQKVSTTCFACALPLSLAAVGLCAGR